MENDQQQAGQGALDHLFKNRDNPEMLRAFNSLYGPNSAEKYLNETASTTLQDEALIIPKSQIDFLKSEQTDPLTIEAFNSLHGAGAAERILGGGKQAAPKDSDKNGVMYDTLVQAPLAGIEDVFNGVAQFGDWVSEGLTGTVPPRLVWGDGNGMRIVSGEEVLRMQKEGTIHSEGTNFVEDAESLSGSIVQGVTTFAVPYFGAFGKIAKSGKVIQGLVAGAVVDGVVMNPNDANLTGALEGMGADMGVVTELLATDPDDPEWMNRARNVAEGGILGTALESIFYGLKAAKAAKNGDSKAAEEFTLKAEEVSKGIDSEIDKVTGEAVEDAQKTIDMVDIVFPKTDIDGQASLDLDLPEVTVPKVQTAEEIATATKVPFRLTAEQAENIRYATQLASDNPQEAARLMQLSFRSVDTMNDYDDVLAQLSATKHVMQKQFLEMKGGEVQRWDTVRLQTTQKIRRMADLLNKSPEDFLADITGGLNVPAHELAAEILSKDQLYRSLEIEVSNLAKEISEGRVTGYGSMEEAKLALKARIEIAANLGSVREANRSNVGRALAAAKMTRVADPKLQDLIRNSVSNSDLEAVAKAIANSDQPLKAALNLGDGLQKALDMVNHYRINALLSGVGTQQVNLIGTALNSVMIPLQQIMGGEVKHGVRTLAYQLSSSLEAMRMATEAFRKDDTILDVLNTKFDMQDDVAKGNKSLPMQVISLPSRLLLTMDEFFKQATYRGRVMADAAMEADNAGLKGAKRDEFIQDYLTKSFGVNGNAIRTDALLQSQRASFTEALEAGSIGQKFQAMGRGKGVGSALFRFVLPFIRTPINILSQSFQNMPVLQHTSKRFKDDLRSGDPIREAQARGKVVTAYALLGVGYFLAGRGDFTGGGPSDPRIRAEWLKNNQPYSIKVSRDDGSFYWISYQRFEPIANVLSIFADVNEIVSDPYNESETSKLHITAALTLAIADNTVNKTFTRGLSDLFKMMTGDTRTGEKSIYSMLGSFVPNVVNQANGDEAFREVRSATDVLLSRTGLYEDVDPKRNVLGEVITRPNSKMDPMGIFNIGNYRQEDAVVAELSRVSMKDGSAFSQLSKTIFMDGKNESLQDMPYKDGPQSMFDKLLEQTSTTEIGGMTMREKLAEVMVSDRYVNKAIDGSSGLGARGTKGQMINRVIKAYRDKAKSEIPEFRELLIRSQESKRELIKSQILENANAISQNSQDRFKNFDAVFPNQ